MGSFSRIIGGMGAVALAGITLGAAAPPSSAHAMPRRANDVNVPCDPDALVTAIQTANGDGATTLHLSPDCVYT